MPTDDLKITDGITAFADSVGGAIVWPKSLGRPNKPTLSAGFSVLIEGTDVQGTAEGGPVFEVGFVLEPQVEDVDGGPDHYRVEFYQAHLKSVEELTAGAVVAIDQARKAQIVRQATYKVMIALRPGVTWSGAGHLKVHPHERSFVKHEERVVLPDFKLGH